MFVPNFIILCQAVAEKSLTEKKVYTHTRTRTQTSSQKRQKLYTPYILRICRGYKDTDQLCSNCIADQHLCFCYTDSTIQLLKSKISSFYTFSETVQAGLCQTRSQGSKTFFHANSAEHEISMAHKY